MNNILDDVIDLKKEIIDSEEYNNYNKYLNKIESNEEINSIVNKIKELQKKVVLYESNHIYNDIDDEINTLFEKLKEYEDYNMYIKYSKKLNELLSKVQNNFQNYFNSLMS
ncbi:MAG: YlbF family regulator [Bacilli bacterium]|nr:YlbF family regulator [Bacilli bacterium]